MYRGLLTYDQLNEEEAKDYSDTSGKEIWFY
jgi:hypothetical protein